MVKIPPAMQEPQVRSLDQEGPLEEGVAIHSSILGWRIPMGRGAWRGTVHGAAKSRTGLSDFTFTFTVRASGQEDPLEKGMATHSSIRAWITPWTRSLVDYSPEDHKESGMTDRLTHFETHTHT